MDEETFVALLCLLTIALTHIVAHFEQRQCGRLTAHEQVAQVGGEVGDEIATIEATAQHLIEE